MKWVILIALGLLMYILYINGYMVMQRKVAVSFIGQDRGRKASFIKCHGRISRIYRVKDSRVYHFHLNAHISEGQLEIQLKERDQIILSLTPDHNEQDVELSSNHHYRLNFLFHKASGDYELSIK